MRHILFTHSSLNGHLSCFHLWVKSLSCVSLQSHGLLPTKLLCQWDFSKSIERVLQYFPRVLEWVAISFSRGSSWPRDWTWVSHIAGRCFTLWATREAPYLSAITNNTSNMDLQISLSLVSFLWGMYSEVKLLNQVVVLCLVFWGTTVLSSITDALLYIPFSHQSHGFWPPMANGVHPLWEQSC